MSSTRPTRGKGEGSIYQRNTPTDKRWVASIELPRGIDGKRRRKIIAHKNKAEVIKRFRQAQLELRKTGDLQTNSPTVEQWLDTWLTEIAEPRLAPNTVTGYRNSVEAYLKPILGRKKLDKLTAGDVRRLHQVMAGLPRNPRLRDKEVIDGTELLSPTTILLAHNTLSSALKAAMIEGKISINVCELVERPRRARTEHKSLTFEQAVKLLKHVADKPDGALWATYLFLGLRRGEAIGIEAERVTERLDLSWQIQRISNIDNVPADYEYRHIRASLYFVRPKSAKGHRVPPLVEPLRTILQRHIGGQTSGLVFLDHKGEAWDPGDVSKAWKQVLGEAGLPTDIELHGSRRTTATLLFEAGVPMEVIREILGHVSIDTTQLYVERQNEKVLTQALSTFSEYLAINPD